MKNVQYLFQKDNSEEVSKQNSDKTQMNISKEKLEGSSKRQYNNDDSSDQQSKKSKYDEQSVHSNKSIPKHLECIDIEMFSVQEEDVAPVSNNEESNIIKKSQRTRNKKVLCKNSKNSQCYWQNRTNL